MSTVPEICTYPVLKGIKANLILRNSQRILAPPFLVIIRHPWGCHQSWAGWPASQLRPRDWSDFKGRVLGGMVMAGEGVLPSLIQYRSQGNGRPWISGIGVDLWHACLYTETEDALYLLCFNFSFWEMGWWESFTRRNLDDILEVISLRFLRQGFTV